MMSVQIRDSGVKGCSSTRPEHVSVQQTQEDMLTYTKVKEQPHSIHRDPVMSNLPLVHAGRFCKAPVLIVTDYFWGLLGEETSWGGL